MITGEDIERLEEEASQVKTQLVVIDTQQFFELEIPADMDPEEFINSEFCRFECAARIINQTTDLNIDRVITEKDDDGEWISP
ncbi:hypothetical protein RDp07_gp10 [Roseobacter phage RD-1410Ws-07]|uniref:Uncharacterized protein n=2 Tax=Sanyabayvirus DS1410Ws06 TaxID=2844087 RepID=A0A191VYN5_9CAUD|nr:hypothetical protein HYO98_gp13 [Dinoroseobacter phage DS-1410Ws-06]ANJ20670.1 hypothetical protein DSp06_gp13 [Dinoroseobacter phage DS-1410Ws-06]ANJ20821.1 hypothetical protein RDp07_gp10 [Roseobacter phage RD-1410Ws-07]